MPSRAKKVRFETEYNSSFKAFSEDVYRSPLIEALVTEPSDKTLHKQSRKTAGLLSQKFHESTEPPFQHKKSLYTTESDNSYALKHYSSNGKTGEGRKNDGGEDATVVTPAKPKKNRALEFKAGLRPESLLQEKKHPVSEYKRQYEWKKSAADNSPLLNAEKIVFESHTDVPRFVRDKTQHKTEYQSKFAANKVKRVDHKVKEESDKDKKKLEDLPTSTVKRLLQTSHNPAVPFFAHGSDRVYHTEYQANYGSPKKYKYQEGIWLGAKPPHLLPDGESAQGSGELPTNWFQEVLELREKARQYKIRAVEGNYFSREYLEKLDAELEEMFREHSDSEHERESKQFKANKPSEGVPRNIKTAWESDSSNDDSGRKIYRYLGKQYSSPSSATDSATKSSSKNEPVKNEPLPNSEHFGKTYSKKTSSSRLTPIPRLSKKNCDMSQEISSGREASSEESESLDEDRCIRNSSKVTNQRAKRPSLSCENDMYDPDKFNIETIQGIRSNDQEVVSSSMQNNYGSNSERLSESEGDLNGDNLSESSFASQESMARQTLSRAKQRNATFWKK